MSQSGWLKVILLATVGVLASSCGKGADSSVGLGITGFNQRAPAHALQGLAAAGPNALVALESPVPPSLSPAATPANGYIISGAPDYLKATLTRIQVTVDGNNDTLWQGNKVLTITGGAVDVSDILGSLQKIHSGTATSVSVTFQSQAQVKGSLTGSFYTSSNNGGLVTNATVYTQADAAYNAVTHAGGAPTYTHFTAPSTSQEMNVWLSGDSDTFTVTSPCNTPIADGGSGITLSIVFDLNRILRFYSGGNTNHGGGVNPPDPANQAYFFSHSLLGSFVGVFFGTPGTIEGYKSQFIPSGSTTSIPGWMTLIFDSGGNLLSGMLMGDDDNALTIAKGRIVSYTAAADGSVTFSYDIAGGTVTGFKRVSTVNNYTGLDSFSTNPGSQVPAGMSSFAGSAYFELLLKQ